MIAKHCTLIFLRRENQVLLAMKKRGFGKDLYNGVGGKIEPGETIEQALLRETREEINVVPMNYWKVAEHDFINDSEQGQWRLYIHTYLCDEWQGEPSETEEMRPEWFEIDDIPYGKMWEDDEFWLPQVLSGEKVVGEFHFDARDKLTSHNVQIVEKLPHDNDQN